MKGRALLCCLLLAGCAAPRTPVPAMATTTTAAPFSSRNTAADLTPRRPPPEAALPTWLIDPGAGRATGCAPLASGPDARRVAEAKARAELVRQRQVAVESSMTLSATASRGGPAAASGVQWQERVEQRAVGVLEGIHVLRVEQVDWQGTIQLCVWLGSAAGLAKEEGKDG